MALTKLAAPIRAYRPQLLLIVPRLLSSGANTAADDDTDFLCSYKAAQKLKDLHISTQDFMCLDGSYASSQLDVKIHEEETAASERLKLHKLKPLYEEVVPSELVSRLLIHKYPLKDPCTQWLNYQIHAHMKKAPKFTTSYDLMATLTELPRSSWVLLLNHLGEERICVIENWDSISVISHMMYDHGPGDFSGIHFQKGESDASWHQVTKTADISTVIWDGDQVVDAQAFFGLTNCSSSVDSEGKAALRLLMRAKELDIPNFVIWVDNEKIGNILSGKMHVPNTDADWKLFMALKSMRASFDRLVVARVPRELVTFPDSMLRDPNVQFSKNKLSLYPRLVPQSARKWAYELNGLPIFGLKMTAEAKTDMKKFGKPLFGESSQTKYFIEVGENMKVSALYNLMETLTPCILYLAVNEIETKPEAVLKEIYDVMGTSISIKIEKWSVLFRGQAHHFQRSILVTFDGLCLEDCPDADFTISLCSEENKDILIAHGYMELSASAYIHYHGPCLPT